MKCYIDINNLSPHKRKKWLVLRAVDGKVWYYGQWDDEAEARSVAVDIDGFVVGTVEKKED